MSIYPKQSKDIQVVSVLFTEAVRVKVSEVKWYDV